MRADDPSQNRIPVSGKNKGRGPTIAKDVNRKRVYREIKHRRKTTRADLARILGLNKNTVNTIVEEWLQAGFIRDVGQSEAIGVGRKATMIEFAPDNRLAVGIQVSSNAIHGVVTNLYAERVHTLIETVAGKDPATVVESVVKAIGMVESMYDRTPIIGIGVGIPALLNEDRSRILTSSHMGWENTPFLFMMEQELNRHSPALPILLDNSVKLASIGELLHGRRQGSDPFVYCSFGNGIGCSMIINGSILRGESNTAGELGHVLVEPDGLQCGCGRRGCLETVAGFTAFKERIGPANWDKLISGDDSISPALQRELERVGGAIGLALSGLINLINPGIVVFDGPLMQLSDRLLPIVQNKINNHAVGRSVERLRMVRSNLYPFAGSLGAAASVVEYWENQWDALETPT